MYRHHRLDAPVEIAALEPLLQIYGNQTCLPVMTVDQIRPEIDHRQDRQRRLTEKCIFLDLKQSVVTVRFKAAKEALVVDEIILHPFNLCLQNADIFLFPVEVHVKMCLIGEFILHLLFHTGIFGKNHPDIKVFSVNTFRQRTDHICQTSCLNKWNPFRCNKQNIFHANPPKYRLSCLLQSLTFIIQHFGWQ